MMALATPLIRSQPQLRSDKYIMTHGNSLQESILLLITWITAELCAVPRTNVAMKTKQIPDKIPCN